MISADKAEAIRALADADGYIEPSEVVIAARDPDHVLHDEFPWEPRVAAERHWIDIARRLIRLVKLEMVIDHRNITSVAYVVDPDRPVRSRRYVDLTIVAQHKETARQVLLAEMERIVAAIRRARQVAAVLGMSQELEVLVRDVDSVIAAAELPKARKARKATKVKGRKVKRRQREEARA